ncbi:MAG: hypothetical protein OK456_04690 [Thaumarchaeota archaeon]|nr:hypothetical protein [Nitrososphaerota archaeon]
MGVDGLIAVVIGFVIGVWFPSILADILFAEGSLLLVAGGFLGIVSLSPSLMKVRHYFGDRYGDPPAANDDSESKETPKKPLKIDPGAVELVVYGIVLIALSFAVSIVVIAGA